MFVWLRICCVVCRKDIGLEKFLEGEGEGRGRGGEGSVCVVEDMLCCVQERHWPRKVLQVFSVVLCETQEPQSHGSSGNTPSTGWSPVCMCMALSACVCACVRVRVCRHSSTMRA